jgi:hypothetical protein
MKAAFPGVSGLSNSTAYNCRGEAHISPVIIVGNDE